MQSETAVPAAGDPAPPFDLESAAGPVVRLADRRGRAVVLVFFRGRW